MTRSYRKEKGKRTRRNDCKKDYDKYEVKEKKKKEKTRKKNLIMDTYKN